jgi:hypothetical protein
LTQIITKFNKEKAKPYLEKLIHIDFTHTLKCIYWYIPEKSTEWIEVFKEYSDKINNDETFRFFIYLIEESKKDFSELLVPFTKHSDDDIRARAFYELDYSHRYFDVFVEGLKDNSHTVILNTLKSLNKIKDKRLLKYYKNIADRFINEENDIMDWMKSILKNNFNLTIKKLQTMSHDEIIRFMGS